MALFTILGIAAAVLGAGLGVGAHAEAEEINERAKKMIEEAQSLYNNEKHSLESAQKETEKSLLQLGISKKNVLETSIAQFLDIYEHINDVDFIESVGLDEIKNFTLEKQDALHLREMSSIYESTFSSGAAGAATGAVIALAASGSLPLVTGVLSTAGTALVAGEIGTAVGLAGAALSFGAAMTPLAAIAAPAILFSGISSNIKAEENLEKARTMYAEAEAACEKMKTAEVLCAAIAERADMFNDLLFKLNDMFSQCTASLDKVVKRRRGIFRRKKISVENLTKDELMLLAVTRSLAGAVKAVIDTPILTSKGAVSTESEILYDTAARALPAFAQDVSNVRHTRYLLPSAAPVSSSKPTNKRNIFMNRR